MAKPVEKRYKVTYAEALKALHKVVSKIGLKAKGIQKELGLISFEKENGQMFYAQLIDEDGSITVSLSGGMAYYGHKDQDAVPDETITLIFQALDEKLGD